MGYLTAVHTDIGTERTVNQDSLLLIQADTDRGEVLLSAVCDGVGGLKKGELASAFVVRRLETWFRERLPHLMQSELQPKQVYLEWRRLFDDAGGEIRHYAEKNGIEMGTTAAVLLLTGDRYFHMNIGDSRIYSLSDTIRQMTEDHTLWNRERTEGRVTEHPALPHPGSRILTQCIGTSGVTFPSYGAGVFHPGECFLLCTDGFYGRLRSEELFCALRPDQLTGTQQMRQRLKELTALSIARKERDNISSVLVCSAVRGAC